jgi:hypothetical protein
MGRNPNQPRPGVRTQPEQAVCGHGRSYAKSLCRRCFDAIRHNGDKAREKALLDIGDEADRRGLVEQFKEEFVREAKQLVNSVPKYAPRPADERKKLRTTNPRVAGFAAAVLIKNNLDSEQAAKELKPDLAPVEQAELAHKLDTDANVHRAVERQLEKRGLDEKSRERFVEILWAAVESNDPRQERIKIKAMGLLGGAMLPNRSQIEIDTPATLTIKGVEEGLRRMRAAEVDADSANDESAASVFMNMAKNAGTAKPETDAEFDA